MRRVLLILILSLFATQASAQEGVGNPSGLPIPRFVSLKATETNLRTGPGTRYPIQWVLKRENMPVEIIDEFDMWRKVRDFEGASGWVHHSMLSGRRYVMVMGKEPQTFYIDSKRDSKALFKAEGGVIAPVRECELDWCRIQLSGKKAWIEKKNLWGVYPHDIFD